jgi:hypothetical protein
LITRIMFADEYRPTTTLKSVVFWVITRRRVVINYNTTPCNYPEDHRFHQHRGGSLKSRPLQHCLKQNNKKLCKYIITNSYVSRNAIIKKDLKHGQSPCYFDTNNNKILESPAQLKHGTCVMLDTNLFLFLPTLFFLSK